MPEVLADDPAAEGNNPEYHHDPSVCTPACVHGTAHLRQIVMRFHRVDLPKIPAVSGSTKEPEGKNDRRRLEASVRGLLHRLALVLYLK